METTRRRVLGLAAAAAGSAVAGCAGGASTEGDEAPRVSATGTGYDPRNLSVDVGTTVTWANENPTALPKHAVTSEPVLDRSAEWSFDATLAEEGDEASYTFEEPGLYTYVGTVKGANCMCGVVAVGDASYDDPLPCSRIRGGGC